ncbi:hypothetical protein [Streptomyces misionensis]
MSPASSLDPELSDERVAAVALFAGPEHRLVDWYAYIHPRDREGLGRAWHAAADQEPPGGMEATFRVRTADGPAIASFATAVHTRLRRSPDGTWRMAWSNAGHPPPLLVPARGTPRFLTGSGEDPPLCVAPSCRAPFSSSPTPATTPP